MSDCKRGVLWAYFRVFSSTADPVSALVLAHETLLVAQILIDPLRRQSLFSLGQDALAVGPTETPRGRPQRAFYVRKPVERFRIF